MGSKLAMLSSEYYRETGTVYVMKFNMGEYYVYKVGITERNVVDRFMEVVRSMFQANRVIPRCGIKRFRKVANYRKVEQELHAHFREFNYKFEKKFDGSTEFFKVDEEVLLKKYDEMCPK